MCPDLLCQSADHNTYRILGISGTRPTSKTRGYSVRGHGESNDLNDLSREHLPSNFAAQRITARSSKVPILRAFFANSRLHRLSVLTGDCVQGFCPREVNPNNSESRSIRGRFLFLRPYRNRSPAAQNAAWTHRLCVPFERRHRAIPMRLRP